MGPHLGSTAMVSAVVGDGSGKTMARCSGDLRRRRGDDGVRDGVAKTMVRTARSGAARVGVGVWPERLRAPARCGVDRVVVRLREKKDERRQRVRQDEGKRRGQEVVAGTHRGDVGVLNTAAVTSNSGDEFLRPGCTREGERGVRRERRVRGRGWRAR